MIQHDDHYEPRRFVRSPAEVDAIVGKWLDEHPNETDTTGSPEPTYEDFFRERRWASRAG